MTLTISMFENMFLLHTKHMSLVMLKNVFPLRIKTQDSHLKYPNMLL